MAFTFLWGKLMPISDSKKQKYMCTNGNKWQILEGGCVMGWKGAFPCPLLPGSIFNSTLFVVAALHFHDFTTTGKFRQGSNEHRWNHWIHASSPFVPFRPHYAILYLPLSLPRLLEASSFFLLVATRQTLRVALCFLFTFCCLRRVPHLVVFKHHSLRRPLKSSPILSVSLS